uniref:Sodium/potassium-transporting ATPase subunit beta n=1 Tax=Sparus aurata TaxID=8175 RepID=A0A671UKX5_SPAAU
MSGTKEEDRKGSSEWREFFWNPRTHELMGRTATSWGLILLFYLVFYLFLAGMFVLTMYIMLLTLDDYKPTWQDRLTTPGTKTHTPEQKNTPHYQVQTNDNCPPDQYFIQEDSGEVRNNPKRSCQFNRTMLEECSGVSDRFYGYSRGEPCILIKLNRVIGMLPGKDGQSPYVTCGAKREDSDKIGRLAYYPPNGTFNLMYYPYYGKKAQVNYTQPLVAVKFLNASVNTDIYVECKINSNTLADGNERDKFAGRVSFKLRINDK